ncbi:MAG: hypothetical protein ACFBSD_13875 [Paracoccaceae bacterium]
MNTLDFLVTNAQGAPNDNPSGLRVEISGTAAAIPLPAGGVFLLTALMGLGGLRLARTVRA